MKRNIKRLPALLLAIILCLSLLPATAWAANFPSKFYASISLSSSSQSFGTVSGNGAYTKTGTTENRVIYGMEYAGGVFFTVEGNFGRTTSQDGSTIMSDDGWRELRVYNSDLTSYRVIGTVSEKNYAIVDTAMDLSGEEPALYGTYNQSFNIDGTLMAFTTICSIDLTDGHTSNWLQVKGDLPSTDIIYAIAFDKDGTLYGIGADAGDDGGPATLYTIELGESSATATEVGEIKTGSGYAVTTNFAQDMAFDYASNTLYWAENKGNDVYTVDTKTAVATQVGQVKYNDGAYALQSFCIPYDAAFANDSQYMISVICAGGGKVTNQSDGEDEGKAFYMVESGGSLTLALTPDKKGKLLSVKVDGATKSVENLTEYTFSDVTANHVIEVAFRNNLPVTQKNMTWFHYQGRPASFYTQHHAYKFYELPYTTDAPEDGYTQTLRDSDGNPIHDDTIIPAGNYDVHVTHPGNNKYNALDVVYENALQLAKCPGTPGRPVVYGKVGCKQGDLTTISALQDYYGTNGDLIDAAHDEIPVTLVWLNPDTEYNTAGNFYASATIYAAQNLDQCLKDCYTLDNGDPLEDGCLISSRATQVVVLEADEASLIKVQASDASGGAVSGKGVYKNGDKVTVTATVNTNAGYEFKGWQEDGKTVSENLTYEFNANGDRTLTALFETKTEYRVILKTDPQDGGTVTGGGSYEDGSHEATVEATAKPGYYFIGWYEAGNDTAVSTEAEYTFTVEEDGVTLTAKFGIDYLARAEQAKANLASALGKDTFEWQTLAQAVDAYKAAADFVENPPSVIQDAGERYDALTAYYSGIEALDLSGQGIGDADLAKLELFTGVTELNLSGNKGVTGLTNLRTMTKLETLDLSNTVITNLSGLSAPTELETLDLSNNTALTDLSGLSTLTKLETLDLSSNTALTDLSGLSALTRLETLDLSGDRGVTDLTALKNLTALETLDISNTGVTAFDALVNENGKIALYSLKNLTAKNLTLTSISALAGLQDEDTFWYYINWDFTDSTLPDTEENRADIETIQAKPIYQGEFIPPTLWSAPTGGGVVTTPPDKPDYSSCDGGADCPMSAFIDVEPAAWYHDGIHFCLDKGLMDGYGDSSFGPNNDLSRAMLVQILYNYENRPAVSGDSAFADVDGDTWYANAVIWANEAGIVGGYGGGLFGPENNITREQFAAILYRYAQAKGYGTTASFDLSAYGDVSDVSAWAISAMQWACGKDIINGTSPTTLAPQGTATRAQAATMLQRFCEQYSQNEG